MKCTPVNFGDGVTGWVCGRAQRRKKCAEAGCGRPADRACDFKLTGRKAGKTCDRALCAAHAHAHGRHAEGEFAGDRIDYCPAHHRMASVRSVGEWPEARVVITGTHYVDHPDVRRWMLEWWERHGPCVWILGGARHVDTQAEELCLEMGWPHVVLYALWKPGGRFNPEAGRERNTEMIMWAVEVPRRALLAFPCRKSVGTWQCRKQAYDAGMKADVDVFTNRRLTPKKAA